MVLHEKLADMLAMAKGIQGIVDDAGLGKPQVTITPLPMEDMTLGGMVAYTTTSMRILSSLTWEQTESLAQMLQGEYVFSHRQLPWYVGDMLNWAESAFGEAYPQLILDALSDYEKNTLRNYKFVTAAIEPSIRRDDLFFSHHAEVASLATSDEKRFWLAQAVENGWTRDELRKAIRDSRLVTPEGGDETPMPGETEQTLVLQVPMMVNILGLTELDEGSALRKLKLEAVPALAEYVEGPGPGGRKASLALFHALDEMLDAWFGELKPKES